MPDSLLGAALFVALLAPGLCFVLQRESRTPTRVMSTFRDTIAIVAVSVVCNAAALLLLVVLRGVASDHTPDIGRLVRDGGTYFELNYATILGWSGILLLFSCSVAVFAGSHYLKLTRLLGGGISFHSAWWAMFVKAAPEDERIQIHAGIFLKDGGYVAGQVYSYNTDSGDTADREIVLSGDIVYRAPGTADAVPFDTSYVSVSAREMSWLAVTYVDPDLAK